MDRRGIFTSADHLVRIRRMAKRREETGGRANDEGEDEEEEASRSVWQSNWCRGTSESRLPVNRWGEAREQVSRR